MKSILIATISGCLLFFPAAIKGQEKLLGLKKHKESAIERVITPLNKAYLGKLDELMDHLTTSGELNKALVVKNEIDRVGRKPSESLEEENIPERLALLSRQRSAALERALAPIERKYHKELDRLLRNYTSAGNLEAALKVREELAKYRDGPSSDDEEKGFSKAFLIGTVWEYAIGNNPDRLQFGDGKVLVLKGDGSGNFTPGDSREWEMVEVKKRQIRIHWNSGPLVATLNSRLTEMESGARVLERVREDD